jgi:adenosylhomocysteine nucleosidase
MPKIAIVAALKREVKPLIRNWPSRERDHDGRKFKFFEKDDAVLVCGGIGSEATRRATEAIIALYAPAVVYSVGFAGALQPGSKVGDIVLPRRVLDVRDGSSSDTGEGDATLITITSVADRKQKAQLAASYNAIAADMEAAYVARGAQARGVRFAAVKVISDEIGFAMPPMQRFIAAGGSFETSRFVRFALARPWLWPALLRLAGNSSRAAQALSSYLQHMIEKSTPQADASSEAADQWSTLKTP